MPWVLTAAARLRLLATRGLTRLGFREDSFLVLLAVIVGIITAAAAVSFHELIRIIRDVLYQDLGPRLHIYGRGVWLLFVIPTLGGLIVGLVGRYVIRSSEGRGILDVMESVIRSAGRIKPSIALEKIFTSALTIGTGGSAGAEGPIVQIGAAISSAIGQLFSLTRKQMPVLIGCGTAAGISAIFNAPIGGVFFTLEVILQEFSIRTLTPIVIASVVANVTTQAIFDRLDIDYKAIFAIPEFVNDKIELQWASLPSFIILGLLCGLIGVSLTRLMNYFENKFHHLRTPSVIKPAMGGAIVGLFGIAYVVVFGWWLMGLDKPIDFGKYPMPAFFGDGYGVIRQLLDRSFFAHHSQHVGLLLSLLAFLCLSKLVLTCVTLGSGGSGGIIAPSLFLGATGGAVLGMILQRLGWAAQIEPHEYALIGMGAVLAAVVHAPLAAILILMELRREAHIVLPAMLATITATSFARLLFRDSIYTLGLRLRGVQVGTSADLTILRRLTVEQITLEPVTFVNEHEPLQRLVDLSVQTGASCFVCVDTHGTYSSMVVSDDIKTALLQPESIPLLLVREIARSEILPVKNSEDLATVLDTFARYDVDHLPVCLPTNDGKIIGLIGRAALMKYYQMGLAES